MKSVRTMLVLSVLLAACTPRPAPAPATPATTGQRSVWSADFMRTKPGQRARYLRFLEANWARARATALAQGEIRSYRVLALPDTAASAPWDVILLTEYPDSAAYARAEAIFRPILARQGQTLVDGLSGSGPDNPLKTTVLSTVLTAPLGTP